MDCPQLDSAAGSGDGFGEVVAVVREAVESRRGRRLRPRSCATKKSYFLGSTRSKLTSIQDISWTK